MNLQLSPVDLVEVVLNVDFLLLDLLVTEDVDVGYGVTVNY